MKSVAIDPRRNLLVFESEKEAISFCTSWFVEKAQEALALRPVFTVALSGGNTPKVFFESLSHSKEALELPWEKILLFWSDERAVPPDHPDSNFGAAMHFLSDSPFNKAKTFRMEADSSDKSAAAASYEQLIQTYCPEGCFDVVYLGVGEDGHTASLFPGNQAVATTDKKVVSTYVEAKKSWRMSLTFPCINEARHTVVLAFGPAKAVILKQIFDSLENAELPATLIGTPSSPALFVCNQASALDYLATKE